MSTLVWHPIKHKNYKDKHMYASSCGHNIMLLDNGEPFH